MDWFAHRRLLIKPFACVSRALAQRSIAVRLNDTDDPGPAHLDYRRLPVDRDNNQTGQMLAALTGFAPGTNFFATGNPAPRTARNARHPQLVDFGRIADPIW